MESIKTKSCKLALVVTAALLTMAALPVSASSHREAPFISGQSKVDGTDFYMFRSYETGRENTVTFLADYIPFQDPQGGPNFYEFDANALYEIHVDNVGDGKEHLTYQFRFNNASKSTPLTVGGKQVKIPLINSGVITGDNPTALNVAETYTVNLVTEGRRSGRTQAIRNASNDSTTFTKPVDNIGDKSFGGAGRYDTYANQYIYDIKIPGCATNGRVFVGQRTEPFYIAVGPIFDLINLNPLGPESGTTSDLNNKNISTIALEVPITCLTAGTEPVIGGYTTASVRQGRLINPTPSSNINSASKNGGAWSQVSRLGMPLVNEVVIGLEDKDKFNSSKPAGDAQFGDYVTNPTLPALIQTLFPSAVAPTNFPRTDLIEAFLNGIFGLNQSRFVTNAKAANPAFISGEMLRLNTGITPRAQGAQSALGVPGGDNAGFPNGRRPGDDVVDLSLRVAMGALCQLTGSTDTFKVGCRPSDAPAGGLSLTDGVRKTATDYQARFPYLTTPIPGAR